MENLSKEFGVVYLLGVPDKGESLDLQSILDPKPEKVELIQKEGHYNIGWSNQLYPIISTRDIIENEVNQFKEIEKSELLLELDWMLCGHQPAYAIELFSDDILYFKTSFCFECDTWISEIQTEFVRLSLRNKKLFNWLNNIIPLSQRASDT